MNNHTGVHGCGLVIGLMLPLAAAVFSSVVGPAVFTAMVTPAVWASAHRAVEISTKCEPLVA